MQKYSAEWMESNCITEEDIQNSINGAKKFASELTSPKGVMLSDIFWLPFVLEGLIGYEISIKYYRAYGMLMAEITITK